MRMATARLHRASTVVMIAALAANLHLGAAMWFFYFTDYSWAGRVLDLVFPPAVALLGISSLAVAWSASSRLGRLGATLSCLPSLIGGGLYCTALALLAFLSLLNPGVLMGLFFHLHEISGEKLIQETVSPDGSRVAQVYFRGVGAYSAGNGRITVRVKHRLIPLVERDVYYVPVTYEAGEGATHYLSWTDNDTLFIPETQEEVRIGTVAVQFPTVFAIPLQLLFCTM